MGLVWKVQMVDYEVPNPEWERLDDLARLADGVAPTLFCAVDTADRLGPDALRGGRADEFLARMAMLKSSAELTARAAVDEIRAARARTPETLTRQREDWYQVWEPDEG
ncbi:MAG: hypothetical protein LBK42_06235 [Propionibacteriaceae bacterium]|nr:hypothetical protein [Propionibacteriaceae bacterium]